jgi:hypothetical protein
MAIPTKFISSAGEKEALPRRENGIKRRYIFRKNPGVLLSSY